jgi:hypothetical protein
MVTQKKVVKETVEFSDNPGLLVSGLVALASVSIAYFIFRYVSYERFPEIEIVVNTAYFLGVVCLFSPTILALDMMSRFDDRGFPRVKHPHRIIIIVLNIVFAIIASGELLIACILLTFLNIIAFNIPPTKVEKVIIEDLDEVSDT